MIMCHREIQNQWSRRKEVVWSTRYDYLIHNDNVNSFVSRLRLGVNKQRDRVFFGPFVFYGHTVRFLPL